ncbi:hypothetical protein EDC01DRAFT_641466 [Geopyxis carbonaria]|nr:hypothetical protein EDC01DRAFT_641466 [Geopyxis carbonaria]
MPSHFIYRQLFVRPPAVPLDINLAGKTILITGASAGLGLECAKQLLERRASRLVLLIRGAAERGPELRKKLLSSAATPGAAVDFFELDMESPESVVESVAAVTKAGIARLDAAVLNAGVQPFRRYTTPAGTERCLQINHLSTCHLALRLLPLLAADAGGAPGRLTLVGSETHYMAQLTERSAPSIIAAMDGVAAENYNGLMQYHNAKLLLHLFVRELAGRVPAAAVVVNTVNPGMAITKLARDMPLALYCAAVLVALVLARRATIAARTLTHGVAMVGDESHGGFYSECVAFPYSPLVVSEEGAALQKRVWTETMERLRAADPEVDGALGQVAKA